jgi:hypothetical protein
VDTTIKGTREDIPTVNNNNRVTPLSRDKAHIRPIRHRVRTQVKVNKIMANSNINIHPSTVLLNHNMVQLLLNTDSSNKLIPKVPLPTNNPKIPNAVHLPTNKAILHRANTPVNPVPQASNKSAVW